VVSYVAGWGEDGALAAISAYAETIDAIARRIDAALQCGGGTDGQGDVSAEAA
jgi:hypothetical protein